jgi:hypothetical protein
MSSIPFFEDQYENLESLPLDKFEVTKSSIFIIDYNWVYLFVNKYARERINGMEVIGKSVQDIWKEYPHLNFKPIFEIINPGVMKRQRVVVKSKSPVTNKSIEIFGYPLADCYFFSVSELPDKESLIAELKTLLKRS